MAVQNCVVDAPCAVEAVQVLLAAVVNCWMVVLDGTGSYGHLVPLVHPWGAVVTQMTMEPSVPLETWVNDHGLKKPLEEHLIWEGGHEKGGPYIEMGHEGGLVKLPVLAVDSWMYWV